MTANYTEKDFSEMRFRVDKVDIMTYQPLVSFPELNIYSEFSEETMISSKESLLKREFPKVFAYIVFAYDMKSPCVTHNIGLLSRKKEALLLAGFKEDKKTGKFCQIAEKLVANDIEEVNRMIIRFLRILKNPTYETLQSYYQSLHRQNYELMSGMSPNKDGEYAPLTSADHKRLVENTKVLNDEIRELTSLLMSGDDDDNILNSLYDSIETDDTNITPEQIARKLYFEENLKLFNPYESDDSIEDFILRHKKEASSYTDKKRGKK